MAEKLTEQLTISWSGKIMDVMTTDGTIDTTSSGRTFSSVQHLLDDETRFTCTVSDNYEIDTVTNTNENFVVRCITDSSFVYTWADPTYHTDIIDTITITTRYKSDEPVTGANKNLNILTLENTTWEFTNVPEMLYLYLINPANDISTYENEWGDTIELTCQFNGVTYQGLYSDASPNANDLLLFERGVGWDANTKTIKVIDGLSVDDERTIDWFKNNATLISQGDDEPEGGDTPSTPTIGPNAQLTEFLTGIADAIREKTGTSDLINPQDFATTIAEMQTGSDVESNPDEMLKAMVEGTMFTFDISTISTVGTGAFANSLLIDVNLPNCTSIYSNAFQSCSNLIKFSATNCNYLGASVFQSCYNLTFFDAPAITSIGSYAFQSCSNLSCCSFPNCTYIGPYAFQSAGISKIYLPKISSIGNQAFYYCRLLKSVNSSDLPLISTLSYTFQNCSGLSYVNLPNITSTYQAFTSCNSLDTASLPNCSYVGYGTFASCYKLQTVNVQLCNYLSQNAFWYCSALKTVSLPNCTYVGSSAFYYCSQLSTLSLPKCSYIGSRAFYYCSSLSKLYLTSTSVVSIYNSQILMYTPMQYSSYLGYFGSIYVPNSLLASYKANTYWSYYSSRFVGV